LLDSAELTFIDAGASTVSGSMTVGGSAQDTGMLLFDQGNGMGGSSLAIDETLNNSNGSI
jgi:hypothetical protein